MTGPKILLFDIETSPILAWTFSLFKTTIGIGQIEKDPRVMCWSARWVGTRGKAVMFDSEYKSPPQVMLQGIRDLLDEADVVVGYNSDGFDVPWLNTEFLRNGIELPSPFQQVDLYKLNKRHLYLPSRKLDYMSHIFLADRKESHTGFQLWLDCIGDDPERKAKAWKLMERYAKKDTLLLEPLLDLMSPFVRSLNYGLYGEGGFRCTKFNCGSANVQARGFSRTTAGVFQRYQCNDCGGWSKDPKRVATTALRPLGNN